MSEKRTWSVDLVKKTMKEMRLDGINEVTEDNFRDFARRIRREERKERKEETPKKLIVIKNQKKVRGVFDIDGSLGKYVYGDQELLKDQSRLNSVLSLLPVFPWVQDSDILFLTDDKVFITGRKKPQEDLTRTWIKRNLGVRGKYELILVSYESKEQYVSDKKHEITHAASSWRKTHGDDATVIFVDDDPDILAWMREFFTGPNDIIIAVDKNGKASRIDRNA